MAGTPKFQRNFDPAAANIVRVVNDSEGVIVKLPAAGNDIFFSSVYEDLNAAVVHGAE